MLQRAELLAQFLQLVLDAEMGLDDVSIDLGENDPDYQDQKEDNRPQDGSLEAKEENHGKNQRKHGTDLDGFPLL